MLSYSYLIALRFQAHSTHCVWLLFHKSPWIWSSASLSCHHHIFTMPLTYWTHLVTHAVGCLTGRSSPFASSYCHLPCFSFLFLFFLSQCEAHCQVASLVRLRSICMFRWWQPYPFTVKFSISISSYHPLMVLAWINDFIRV